MNDENWAENDWAMDEALTRIKDAGGLLVNGAWEVPGDLSLEQLGLTQLPPLRLVGGSFSCSYNQLTSLEGAPREVGGDFYCHYNRLTSLEGASREVGGDFYCSNNKLTSLEGAPTEVGGNFSCHNNQLTSLEGAPREVGEGFYCSYNRLPEGETYEKWLARQKPCEEKEDEDE